jgi:hypothetical protein
MTRKKTCVSVALSWFSTCSTFGVGGLASHARARNPFATIGSGRAPRAARVMQDKKRDAPLDTRRTACRTPRWTGVSRSPMRGTGFCT